MLLDQGVFFFLNYKCCWTKVVFFLKLQMQLDQGVFFFLKLQMQLDQGGVFFLKLQMQLDQGGFFS